MSARTWLYSKLNDPTIVSFVGGPDNPRIFAKKTMTSANEEHPFIVFKLGVESNMDISEEVDISRQYVQIWVHDNNQDYDVDYMKIDNIILAIRKVLKNANSAGDNIWTTQFLEVSQDFNDDTLNTIFKYARFLIIKSE